jgi:biopolymer transport protein ExbD
MASDSSGNNDDLSPIAAINVTPFVDVVLVLLVIFVATAPILLKETFSLQLPKAGSKGQSSSPALAVVINRSGQILVNGAVATQDSIQEAARDALGRNPQAQAVLSADEQAKHGDVVRAMDWIQASGLTNFAIQFERPDS